MVGSNNYFPCGAYIVAVPERQITFVGTNHHFKDLGRHLLLKRRLTGIFRNASHIMVEGCAPFGAIEDSAIENSDSVQSYARSFCSPDKPLIESEAGVEYASLYAPYGCKPHLLGAWVYLSAFNQIIYSCPGLSQNNNEKFNKILSKAVDNVLSHPTFKGIDFQQSCVVGYRMVELAAQKKPVWSAAIHFTDWFQSVRDYDIFMKRTEELAAL